ncbi:MAG: hypothetical protein IJN56_02450 [Clostridia bacterium]|nr:hypothetical protein [Clostridia bacterium]
MPHNDKSIKIKDINGEKYIRARFSITIFVAIIMLAIVFLSFIKNDIESVIYLAPLSIIVFPIIVFDILRGLGVIGPCCVLCDDRLYYFRAMTFIDDKSEKSNGYVLYNDIKNVTAAHHSRGGFDLVIQGDKFKIIIANATHKTIDAVKQMAHIDENNRELYDSKGILYQKYSDIVFYDKNGVTYKKYGDVIIDENGKNYDVDYCYIDSCGCFYYTEEEMDFYDSLDKDFVEYYTDKKEIYVSLRYFVYWDKDEKMYCYDGTYYYELTEFNKN